MISKNGKRCSFFLAGTIEKFPPKVGARQKCPHLAGGIFQPRWGFGNRVRRSDGDGGEAAQTPADKNSLLKIREIYPQISL